jgi:hypothetical protein
MIDVGDLYTEFKKEPRTVESNEYYRGVMEFASFLMKNGGAARWTTEPPTVEGWYWAKWAERHKRDQIVYLQKDEKFARVLVIGDTYSREVSDFTLWLGPLPVPEPPKESEKA